MAYNYGVRWLKWRMNMIERLLQLPDNESFFLFGPRATGKTTIIRNLPWFEHALYINLLKADEENRFSLAPDELEAIVLAMPAEQTHVIIDEVQKIPKLLDVVHDLIESTDKKFILTGSSARRLKRGGANLLAGRAFTYSLFPFCYLEIAKDFNLDFALRFGMLPKVHFYKSDGDRRRYLEAYSNTYLKEEVWAEQFIRELDPFRYFLNVAAQTNGKLVNFSKISRDVGVDTKTIQQYFSILEDTLLGFFLNAYQHSFRKRLSKAPKFYFFDTGVVNELAGLSSLPVVKGTSRYGELFEHFIILQCIQLASYYHLDFRFSYLQTKDGAEIDLVVERPGRPVLFIEIKSSEQVTPDKVVGFKQLAEDFGECEAVCFSRDKYAKEIHGITVLPWVAGLQKYFSL